MLSVLLDGRHCRPTLTVAKMTTVIDGRQCRLVCRGLNASEFAIVTAFTFREVQYWSNVIVYAQQTNIVKFTGFP